MVVTESLSWHGHFQVYRLEPLPQCLGREEEYAKISHYLLLPGHKFHNAHEPSPFGSVKTYHTLANFTHTIYIYIFIFNTHTHIYIYTILDYIYIYMNFANGGGRPRVPTLA